MNEFLRQILYLPKQASTISTDIDHLHYWVIGTTMAGSSLVFFTALWFTFRYRRREEGELTPHIRAGVPLELGFIGLLVTLFVTFWVIGFHQYVRIRTPPKDAMIVYVTAKQWMWKFSYPEGKSSIATLVVPARRKVKLIMTSRDVIHSFFVPAFRLKQDVLPGRYETLWFEAKEPGLYKILCAEYCGLNHSRMWGDVVVLDPERYDEWLEGIDTENLVNFPEDDPRRTIADQDHPGVNPSPTGVVLSSMPKSLADRGRLVAERRGCLSCHTLDGQQHIAPTWRGLWGSTVILSDGSQVVADEAYLTESMMDPMAKVVAGFLPVMPTYQGLLEPAEVAALLELMRSIRDPLPSKVLYPVPLIESPERPPLSHVDPDRARQILNLPSERTPP
ncbi:cytochrome c oxidase subunit II [Vulgatibacter incomptus]|uniref:cytochrome-c oxidase n=1 Tax=Vulgatibacter incomptus TaxID=1391653 RepID=A0A0K1PA06_9BACT|nr:cytochrome c oxidase subunit II [Vulgatibacter incomptus]AKU90246.1 Cytochrome c oxidase polypeptide II [Vulgatibacter incomptus]